MTPAYPAPEELLSRGVAYGERLVTAFRDDDPWAGMAVVSEILWADRVIGDCAYGCATWKTLAFAVAREFERISAHARPLGTNLGPLLPRDAPPAAVVGTELGLRAVVSVVAGRFEEDAEAIVQEVHASGEFNRAILYSLAKLVHLARTEANNLDARLS